MSVLKREKRPGSIKCKQLAPQYNMLYYWIIRPANIPVPESGPASPFFGS